MIARARKVLAAVAAEPNGWHAGQVLSVESEPIVYLELARKRERKQSVRLDEGEERKTGRGVETCPTIEKARPDVIADIKRPSPE